jgi:hypothetical protein
VFDRIAAEVPAFAGLKWRTLPATGASLHVPGSHPMMSDEAAQSVPEIS